ncbi:hypothetical protein BC830DRAFT_1093513 [Chytriomyces sp. MP71]|nr:hypothetical protein BC830DRAFT_1093513 [Chytriomyces sp. MP71]
MQLGLLTLLVGCAIASPVKNKYIKPGHRCDLDAKVDLCSKHHQCIARENTYYGRRDNYGYEASPAPVGYSAPQPAPGYSAPQPVAGYNAPQPAAGYYAPTAPAAGYNPPQVSAAYAHPQPAAGYVAPAAYAHPQPAAGYNAPQAPAGYGSGEYSKPEGYVHHKEESGQPYLGGADPYSNENTGEYVPEWTWYEEEQPAMSPKKMINWGVCTRVYGVGHTCGTSQRYHCEKDLYCLYNANQPEDPLPYQYVNDELPASDDAYTPPTGGNDYGHGYSQDSAAAAYQAPAPQPQAPSYSYHAPAQAPSYSYQAPAQAPSNSYNAPAQSGPYIRRDPSNDVAGQYPHDSKYPIPGLQSKNGYDETGDPPSADQTWSKANYGYSYDGYEHHHHKETPPPFPRGVCSRPAAVLGQECGGNTGLHCTGNMGLSCHGAKGDKPGVCLYVHKEHEMCSVGPGFKAYICKQGLICNMGVCCAFSGL